MSIVFAILSVVLAIAAILSAVVDFRQRPDIVDLMNRLGHRPGFERLLGIIKGLGAIGLFIGLGAHAIGVVAAGGFVIYFGLAVRAHRSIDDSISDAFPAIVLWLVSLATLATGVFA